VVLAGGAAFPGCARLICFFGTGWKACATDLKDCSNTEKMARPLHPKCTRTFKAEKSETAGRLKDGIITPKAFFSAG
jgi:hypothetical protein